MFVGIVTLKLDALAVVVVPMLTGEANEPVASESCAVNVFAVGVFENPQLVTNEFVSENVAPAQYVVAACVGEFIPITFTVRFPEELFGLVRPDPGLLLRTRIL